MVSSHLLSFISRRLCEIKDNNEVFGGCNIIAVGDFFQLRPVKSSFPFTNTLIWHLFDPVFLKENMRQNEDTTYFALLNRVRIGLPSDNDIQILKSRLLFDSSGNYLKYLHIFPTRKQVENHNEMQLCASQNNVVTVHATHYYSSSDNYPAADVNDSHIPLDERIAGGLLKVFQVSIHARFMLIRNIDTDAGLVNGAMGTVTEIMRSPDSEIHSTIYIKFDNPNIGRIFSRRTNDISRDHDSIPIYPINHEFIYMGRHIIRNQFPLALAWASTVHKVQGLSLDSAVIDLGSAVFDRGMAYVALSRLRTLQGLYLTSLDPSKIQAYDSVIDEYERLKIKESN